MAPCRSTRWTTSAIARLRSRGLPCFVPADFPDFHFPGDSSLFLSSVAFLSLAACGKGATSIQFPADLKVPPVSP